MNEETLEPSIKSLSDHGLNRVVELANAERAARARKRKEDAIAKIKELAGSVPGLSVSIKGARGRPPAKATPAKARALPAK